MCVRTRTNRANTHRRRRIAHIVRTSERSSAGGGLVREPRQLPPLPLPLGLLVDALSPREAHGCWRTPPPPWPPPPHACSTTTVAPAPRADATLADLTPPPPPPQPPLRGARCGFSAEATPVEAMPVEATPVEATPVEATPVEAPPLTPESCDRRRLGAILVACPPHCARRRRWSRRAVRRCPAS